MAAPHPTYLRLMEEFRRTHGLVTQSEVARFLNEPQQKLNNWARRGVPKKMIIELAARAGSTAEYIATGVRAVGTIPASATAALIVAESPAAPYYDSDARVLLSALECANQLQRTALLSLAKAILPPLGKTGTQ